jgi:hypothetical protein
MESAESVTRESGFTGRSTPDLWVLGALLLVTACGGWLRLTDVDQVGLKGSDNTYYTNMAHLWARGELVYSFGDSPALYHRPVVFAVYGLAIRVLGFSDASIKTANAVLDTMNILLVFLLAFILSRRNPWPALTAAAVYSVLPFTILISRNELTHILSTSTLLISMVLISLAWFTDNRGTRMTLVILSGLATGLCALTHEEMIFVAVAPAVYLALRPLGTDLGWRARLSEATVAAGAYLVGVLAVAHVMLLTNQADAQARASGIIAHRVSQAHYLRFFERPLKFGWNALIGTSSTTLAYLVILLVILLVIGFVIHWGRRKSVKRLSAPPIEDLPMWTVVGYLGVHSFFFIYYAARLFVPLIPLVIVWFMVRSASLANRYAGRRASKVTVVLLATVISIANLGHISTLQDFVSSRFPTWTRPSLAADFSPRAGWSTFHTSLKRKSWARKRFEELGHAVTENRRLLVGPSTFHPFPGRRLLQVGFYFGDKSVYLYDHDQPLDRLIEEERIGFVLFTSHQVDVRPATEWKEGRRYRYRGRWGPLEPLALGRNLGFEFGEHTNREELERLKGHMTRRGARIILGKRDLLSKNPSWSDPISYVVWVLDREDWPPLDRALRAQARSLELVAEARYEGALELLDITETDTDDWGRFRLRLTAARILTEQNRPGKAGRRITDAMALFPRSTIVATALNEVYSTRLETREMYDLFSGLLSTTPDHRALRDLVLGLSLNLADFAIENGDEEGSVVAFQTIGGHLKNPGSRRFTKSVADWCVVKARLLAESGRSREADAARTAASSFAR